MSFVLSLDVGDKRVGVALGSRSPASAGPLGAFERTKGKAEQEILKLIEKHKIKEIVVGLPLSEDGTKNEQCFKIEHFCRRLQMRCEVTLTYVDEYASSSEAAELLSGVRRKNGKDKGRLDAASAALILKRYFEMNK